MSRAPHSRNNGSLRVAVIGAGVIGLSCALELRRRGAEVVVYERGVELGGGATIRAAGMLGLASEAAQEKDAPAVFGLAHRAALLWPDFAADVARHGGGAAGYSTHGTILVARSAAELEWVQLTAAACQARGLPADWLEPQDLKRREAALSGPVTAALLLTSDSQVDAAVLLQRLGVAASRAGISLRLGRPVERIGASAQFTLPDGDRFDRVLLATGASLAAVGFEGRPGVAVETGLAPVVPVKGQMLALAPIAGAPRHVIRMRTAYVAPKDRWILVGATVERGRNDTGVDPDVSRRLRQEAASVVGVLADAPEVAAWAGVRPGAPDDAPMIGESRIPGVYAALGHYRNGILFAPATAEIVADQMLDGKVTALASAFDPLRFDNRFEAPHSP
ncbi:MAG: FAD-dependent oxidoreductase [Alphaproteobacteria bacterium]|nr:FAD-dependent oxidoreductase [Alphaproteobacteria bacterium]